MDVLAVLKSMRLTAEAYLEAQGVSDDDDSYSAAIDAVADLVEAGRELRNDYHDPECESSDAYQSRMRKARARFDAALARFGGVK
jgi:hypothetical protein